MSVYLKMSRHEKKTMQEKTNKGECNRYLYMDNISLQLSLHFSEMTWNEVDCNSQDDTHQHLPAVNTQFINAKSQWLACQGQYTADGNWSVAAAAHEMESRHSGVRQRVKTWFTVQ